MNSRDLSNSHPCTSGSSNNCHCNRVVKKAKITFVDAQIGRLVQALKDTGRYENSLIVFSGDNGAPMEAAGNNYPLWGLKLTSYEGGVRPAAFVHSPLLSSSPYIGTWYEGIVHQTDWLPTFAGLAGAQLPSDQVTGLDLWDALQGNAGAVERTEALLAFGTLRVGDYKLIVSNPSDRGFVVLNAV